MKSLFYLKIMTKSSLLFAVIGFIIASIIILVLTRPVTVIDLTIYNYFNFAAINLFLLINTVYLTLKEHTIFTFIESGFYQKLFSILKSSLIFIVITYIIQAFFIVVFFNYINNIYFLMHDLIHFLLIWLLSNFLAVVIGITMGRMIKHPAALAVSLVIYGLFFFLSLKSLPTTPLSRYLNVFDERIFIRKNNIANIVFNLDYLYDKLFIGLISIIIFMFGKIVVSKRRRLPYIVTSILLTGALCFIVIDGNSRNQQFLANAYPTMSTSAFTVTDYDMNLTLDTTLSNEVTMYVKGLKNDRSLLFLLDDVFNVQDVVVHNQSVNFTHQNHLLTIEQPIAPNEEVILKVIYDGTVHMRNNIGMEMFYVTKYTVNLLDNIFYWYPKTAHPQQSHYTATVSSDATLFSNLTKDQNTTFTGTSTGFHLFAGKYQEMQQDGITYIIPTNANIALIRNTLQMFADEPERIHLQNDVAMQLQQQHYQQVIISIWDYDYPFIQFYENTLLLNSN